MPPEEEINTGDGAVKTQEEPRAEAGVEESPNGSVAVDGERLVELYRRMILVRTVEEATQRGFRKGKIGGSCASSITIIVL